MIPTGKSLVDGHWYGEGDEIPDLGSLSCVSDGHDGKLRNYEGLSADKDKLPKYDDLETGSSAFLYGNPPEVYKYEKTTKTWCRIG